MKEFRTTAIVAVSVLAAIVIGKLGFSSARQFPERPLVGAAGVLMMAGGLLTAPAIVSTNLWRPLLPELHWDAETAHWEITRRNRRPTYIAFCLLGLGAGLLAIVDPVPSARLSVFGSVVVGVAAIIAVCSLILVRPNPIVRVDIQRGEFIQTTLHPFHAEYITVYAATVGKFGHVRKKLDRRLDLIGDGMVEQYRFGRRRQFRYCQNVSVAVPRFRNVTSEEADRVISSRLHG